MLLFYLGIPANGTLFSSFTLRIRRGDVIVTLILVLSLHLIEVGTILIKVVILNFVLRFYLV